MDCSFGFPFPFLALGIEDAVAFCPECFGDYSLNLVE